jgi:hypothetical protein
MDLSVRTVTFAASLIALPMIQSDTRTSPGDRASLEAVELEWLHAEHDRATLDRVLADDFVHPVAAGVFLTKAQHIDWVVAHPPPVDRRQRFDRLVIRTYGDVGIVTGMVIAQAPDGREDRSVFTDVFVKRDGRWQAVNAQENAVPPLPAR